MHSFPEQRKGLADKLASAFCNAAEFLREEKIGGIKAGTVFFFTVLIAAVIAYSLYPTLIFFYVLIIGGTVGQIAQFLICKRKGLGDYLVEIGLRYAGLAVGWWISYTYSDFDSFSSAFPIMIGPFVGDGVFALYRKWYRKA